MEEARWWPAWADGKQAAMVRSSEGGVRAYWQSKTVAQPRAYVARWLETRESLLPEEELTGDEVLAVVVLRFIPSGDEDLGVVSSESPVSRFGYGSSLEWPDGAVPRPLRSLLTLGSSALRETPCQ